MLRFLAPLVLFAAPVSVADVSQGAFAVQFSQCGSAKRVTCIVDGDTFWLGGTKIRIADINTPEVSHAECRYERELGLRATSRMRELLNAAPFTLEQYNRDQDRYGRKLRIVTRGGKSLGDVLVSEGLAEPWTGRRRNWC